MPQINLTSLSGQELRQYLDSSRARGDAAMAYSVLQEMAARRAQAPEKRRVLGRLAGEPRLVTFEDEAPPEAEDIPPMPNWQPPPTAPKRSAPAPRPRPVLVASPEPEPPPPEPVDEEPPLSLAPPPECNDLPDEGLHLRPEDVETRRPRSGGWLLMAAVFVVGVTAGVAGGWWAAGEFRPTPAAAPVQTAALAPLPASPPSPPEAAATTEVIPLPVEVAPEAVPADATELAESEPLVEPAPEPEPVVEPAAAKACASAPTPADREICADPELQRLQRDLRRAYNDALEAHQERAVLRQRQLAWADARNDVTDPERLARLYTQRIRKLEAATAEARAQH